MLVASLPIPLKKKRGLFFTSVRIAAAVPKYLNVLITAKNVEDGTQRV